MPKMNLLVLYNLAIELIRNNGCAHTSIIKVKYVSGKSIILLFLNCDKLKQIHKYVRICSV